eukprot:PhM_4_TR15947/c0_g2_i1/m.50121
MSITFLVAASVPSTISARSSSDSFSMASVPGCFRTHAKQCAKSEQHVHPAYSTVVDVNFFRQRVHVKAPLRWMSLLFFLLQRIATLVSQARAWHAGLSFTIKSLIISSGRTRVHSVTSSLTHSPPSTTGRDSDMLRISSRVVSALAMWRSATAARRDGCKNLAKSGTKYAVGTMLQASYVKSKMPSGRPISFMCATTRFQSASSGPSTARLWAQDLQMASLQSHDSDMPFASFALQKRHTAPSTSRRTSKWSALVQRQPTLATSATPLVRVVSLRKSSHTRNSLFTLAHSRMLSFLSASSSTSTISFCTTPKLSPPVSWSHRFDSAAESFS